MTVLEPELSGTVLIVDDDPLCRTLLRHTLQGRGGHRVLEATSGDEAWALLQSEPVDVVLLDVVMPGLDGFSLCGLIKSSPDLAATAVILLTSLCDRDHRLHGVAEGANDYIIKPADPDELIFRVRNAVFDRRLLDHSKSTVAELRKLERLRDNLTHMLIHDLRSPLGAVLVTLEMIREEPLDDGLVACLDEAITTSRRMAEMLNGMLDVTRLEQDQLPLDRSVFNLSQLVTEAQGMLGVMLKDRVELSSDDIRLQCDGGLIRRVFLNLMSNAVKFSPARSTVQVRVRHGDGVARCEVLDHGPGLGEEQRGRLFEKFSCEPTEGSRRYHSAGLGLYFCRLAVEAHRGRIGVDSQPGQGANFWFELPYEAA